MNLPFLAVASVGQSSRHQEAPAATVAVDLVALSRIVDRRIAKMASDVSLLDRVALGHLGEVHTHFAGEAEEIAGCLDDWEVGNRAGVHLYPCLDFPHSLGWVEMKDFLVSVPCSAVVQAG